MASKVFFLDLGDDFKDLTPLCGGIFCIPVVFHNKKVFKKSINYYWRQSKRVSTVWGYVPCENIYFIETKMLKYIFLQTYVCLVL